MGFIGIKICYYQKRSFSLKSNDFNQLFVFKLKTSSVLVF